MVSSSHPRRVAVFWTLSLLLWGCYVNSCSAKPNIVILMTDDTSYIEYGFGGNTKTATPTLDKLAEKGVSFKVAYSNAICQPTRGMLMTGEYASTTGWWDNGDTQNPLGTDFGTFGHVAKDAGYRTLMVGKHQIRGTAETHGFDSYCMWGNSAVARKEKLVNQWIKNYGGVPIDPEDIRSSPNRFWKPLVVRHIGKDKHQIVNVTDPLSFGPEILLDCIKDFIKESKKPFFIYFPALTAHKDFDPVLRRQAFMPMPILNDKLEIVGREPDGTDSLKSNVEWIDVMVKKLKKILKDAGVEDDTVVFFTSDNGTQGYGKGQVRSEFGIHVPLVVWGGPVVPRPPSCELVSLVDIYATVADWTGGRQIAGDGLNTVRKRKNSVSLVPFLEGKASSVSRAVNVGYRTRRGIVLRAGGFIVDGTKRMWDCRKCLDERKCVEIRKPAKKMPELYAKFLLKRKKFRNGDLDVLSF